MSASKLRTIHVIIIGSFACLLVIVSLYFLVIKKATEGIKSLESQYAQEAAVWQRKASVERELETARQQSRMVAWRYQKYVQEKMPSISFQDRGLGMVALWKEQTEMLGPMLERWPNKTGVTLTRDIQVPAPPVNPNSIDTSIITIPIGTIEVTGDFRSILSHIRSWNKFGRLVRVDPVNLSGESPRMSATYGLTVYVFPRGETIGPAITMAGGGAGQPGAAPGFAPSVGPPPGAPGGPPAGG